MAVWDGLNDPDMLKAALPGARHVARHSPYHFTMTLEARIGPFRRTFTGDIEVLEPDPPRGHVLAARGTNRFFGTAWGKAEIRLQPEADGSATRLAYTVTASTGGRLGQFARPLIQHTGERMVAQFFDRFSAAVAADHDSHSPSPESSA